MAYSREFLEEIKNRNSLEEVIGRVVTLKRAGANLVGRCPFHSEKTPSFTVFPATNSYYCFGCHETGDVIDFTAKLFGLSLYEAARKLAQQG